MLNKNDHSEAKFLKEIPSIGDKQEYQQSMESTVFEVFMRTGAFRVDYLNNEKIGTPLSLAMYVSGNLPAGQPYSRSAKRCLQSGLMLIRQMNQLSNLVAVYVDIPQVGDKKRPALEQLLRDGSAGVFQRLLVVCEKRFEDSIRLIQEWQMHFEGLSACEILIADMEKVWTIKHAKSSLREFSVADSETVWKIE
ncbi:MAG: hypothetical protein N2646_00585 [Bellilinea sp.]|nr:hypothetical protein [Bellilinea sp.]